MKLMLRKKITGKCIMFLHIYNIYHRRKRHFEEIVDSYKVIDDVIICIDIIHLPVIIL